MAGNSYISKEQIKKVEAAIAKAESKTSAEIVTVVVKKSSTTDHVQFLLIFIILAFNLIIVNTILPYVHFLDQYYTPTMSASFILSFALALLLKNSHFIQRILTSKKDQIEQVQQSALLTFYQSDIKKTTDATGVLIYVSLMEHRVIVLADKAINDNLPEDIWQESVDIIIKEIKNKNLSNGLVLSIDKMSLFLSKHFPVSKDDVNELPDHLILKGFNK